MSESYIAQLDIGVWATSGNGDRTLVIDNAKRFKTRNSAKRCITIARRATKLNNCAILIDDGLGSISFKEKIREFW